MSGQSLPPPSAGAIGLYLVIGPSGAVCVPRRRAGPRRGGHFWAVQDGWNEPWNRMIAVLLRDMPDARTGACSG